MKIGTIVKVVDNSLAAPACTVGAYGVVMPEEVWWVSPEGNVAVLFCYNSDVSSDLHYMPWIFAEEDLQPVSGSEDLPKYLFDRMNGSYTRLRLRYTRLFQGAPEELSFPSLEGSSEVSTTGNASLSDQVNLEKVPRDTLYAIIANYADSTHGGKKHDVTKYCGVETSDEVNTVFDVAEACIRWCIHENSWHVLTP
jgi:hypothetical protein